MATMMYVAHGDPTFSLTPHDHRPSSPPRRRSSSSSSSGDETPLPEDAVELKKLICKTHPSKCFSFSLLHMRKMASPPVQIPPMYRCTRAMTMMVSGKHVPYTREMWMRRERAKPHTLTSIEEEEASTDRRK